jgi:hypothetical protein
MTPVGIAYTAVSTGTTVATDKTIGDHAASAATGADCAVKNIFDGKYYCEVRDISVTYNRNTF